MKRNLIYAALGLVFITTSITLANTQGGESNYLATQGNTYAAESKGEKISIRLFNKYDAPEYRRIGGFKK